MKKGVCFILALSLLWSMSGCSSDAGEETKNVTLNTPVPEQESVQPKETTSPQEAGEETVAEQVLLDEQGIIITAKSLDKSGWFGPELKLLIENNSDKDLTVQVRSASVNGFMVETMMTADVAQGKKANDSLVFSDNDIDNCGITTVGVMEFSFHIFTTDGWETYLDSEQLRVETSAYETLTDTYDATGIELYEGNGITIRSKGLQTEGTVFGPELFLYIENNSEKAITVQVRDTSVNGFMVDSLLSEEVLPGKKAVGGMTLMNSTLEENEITTITDMEFSFHIFESDGWDTIVDTDVISLTIE